MDNTINIFSVTDDNYAPYCGVMLTSVFENNKHHSFNVFIFISEPLKKRNQSKFQRLGKKYGNSIEFIYVDDSSIRKHSIAGRWSIATFYKLFLDDLLPESVHKVLYLDGDLVVTGDLSGLWNININEYALAAVPDINFEDCPRRFKYPIEAGCFNGGVLLINRDYWRNKSVGQRCLDFFDNQHDKIVVGEQDVMNAVLWKEIHTLPLTYNYQIQFLRETIFNAWAPSMQKEVLETFESPCIIHYAYDIKPWAVLYHGLPFYKEWKLYKNKSPWSCLFPTFPKRKTINWLIKIYIVWPLRIMKRDPVFINV